MLFLHCWLEKNDVTPSNVVAMKTDVSKVSKWHQKRRQIALHTSAQWFVPEQNTGFLHCLYRQAVLELTVSIQTNRLNKQYASRSFATACSLIKSHLQCLPLIQWFLDVPPSSQMAIQKIPKSLWKHAYSNILKILQPKKENFPIKTSDIFHISAQNIDCGYSLEWGSSNEYLNLCFLAK